MDLLQFDITRLTFLRMNMIKVFAKKYSRANAFEYILNWIVDNYLYRLSRKHLAAGRRQVAEFSFDLVSRRINLDGVYDIKELSTLIDWLKTTDPSAFGGSVLDIGANIGNHSLYFSNFFKKIHCFEPSNKIFSILKINSILANNIECYQTGISDTDGVASLLVTEGYLGCSQVTNTSGGNTQEISIAKLDSMADKFEDVSLIKLDVEGHEYEAISGGEFLIRKYRPYILFEQHESDFHDGDGTKVIDLLKQFGYQSFATIREYPRLNKGWNKYLRYICIGLLRLVNGSEMRVVLADTIEPEFYPFIVAVPAK